MKWSVFLPYLAVTAGVTYLIRMLPLTVFRKEIKSRFVRSFLAYIPYAVLGAMTFPDVFYSTGDVRTAVCGVAVAVLLAWRGRSLLTVALAGKEPADGRRGRLLRGGAGAGVPAAGVICFTFIGFRV